MAKRKRRTHKNASLPTDSPPPDSRVREGQCDPHRLAHVYLRCRGAAAPNGWSLKYWRQDWWMWNGRRYCIVPEGDLRAEVTSFVKRELDRWAKAVVPKSTDDDEFTVAQVTSTLVTNVLQALRGLVLIPVDIEQPAWVGRSKGRAPVIAMANGLVDLDRLLAGEQDVLRVHSPDWFSPVCLDYPHDPAAPCPQFLAFLNEVLESDEERITLSQEWFGYCLTADTSLQKFLMVPGEGGNGKTVWVDVLIGLLGPDNVSHVPLELMGKPFHLLPTLGKLANIVTEVGEIDKAAEGILKAYTSGDRMYFDRKHQPGIHARPTARLTFTTNNLPRFRDRSRGLWRRLMLLPFRIVIPPERQDAKLSQKLLMERPGIFNRAIEGLRRLRAQKRFTEPAICRAALEEYRNEANPARAFLHEHVYTCLRMRLACALLYQTYTEWCKADGYDPLNEKEFGKEVARAFPTVRRVRGAVLPDGHRPYAYEGIALRSAENQAPLIVAKARVRTS